LSWPGRKLLKKLPKNNTITREEKQIEEIQNIAKTKARRKIK